MGANTEAIQRQVEQAASSQCTLRFDGTTYDNRFDHNRLKTQYELVFNLMIDGKWRSLSEIARLTCGSEAGVSARLRDMRKIRNGGHTVERRRKGIGQIGLYEYRLLVNQGSAA